MLRATLLLLSLLLFFTSPAAKDTLEINQKGQIASEYLWHLSIDNSDKNFEKILVPIGLASTKTLFNPGDSLYNQFKGLAWYSIFIKANAAGVNQSMAISLAGTGLASLYIDGNKLGAIMDSENDSTSVNMTKFPVFLSLKDTLPHLFTIRYEIPETAHLENKEPWGFAITISESTDFFRTSAIILQYISVFLLPISGIFAALFLIHLLLFLFYRKDLSNLYFALFNACCEVITLSFFFIYTASFPQTEDLIVDIVDIALLLACYSIAAFVRYLFNRRSKLIWFIGTCCLILILLTLLKLEVATVEIIQLCQAFLVFLVCCYVLVVFIRAMVKKEPGSWILGTGIVLTIVLAFSLLLIVVLVGGNTHVVITSTFLGIIAALVAILGIFSIPVSISAFLAWRHASSNKNLEIQLKSVQELSAKTIQQEREKQEILAGQNAFLEKEVASRTQEIVQEKKKSDDLLLNILPHEVAEELKLKGASKAQHFEMTSVLFTDFVHFTTLAGKMTPEELLNELNIYFTAFDHIIGKYGLEKIKTIGDAYLAVSGLPSPKENHAQHAVSAALEMLAFVSERRTQQADRFDIRIGIHSGPLVAGIVGVKKFAYDIWGDTVNTAARMEQNSLPGKINISETTYQLVKQDFTCTNRGRITVKGKGEMEMYFVGHWSP